MRGSIGADDLARLPGQASASLASGLALRFRPCVMNGGCADQRRLVCVNPIALHDNEEESLVPDASTIVSNSLVEFLVDTNLNIVVVELRGMVNISSCLPKPASSYLQIIRKPHGKPVKLFDAGSLQLFYSITVSREVGIISDVQGKYLFNHSDWHS